MPKRSVGVMSCTAKSGIYLVGVCIMLRHLCSSLAQHIWLHNSYKAPEKQGQKATHWSKMHRWTLNKSSFSSDNWNLARNMRSKSSEIHSYSPCILQWINITHNWSKTAHFTASPNGTISHWLSKCKARISFPGIELTGLSQVFDQETAWMLGKQLSLWWGSRGFLCSFLLFAPVRHNQHWGTGGFRLCSGGKSQSADVLWAL